MDSSKAPQRGNTPSSELQTELDSFRQQWLNDLRSRHAASGAHTPPHLLSATAGTATPPAAQPSPSSTSTAAAAAAVAAVVAARARRPSHLDEDHGFLQGRSFDDLPVATGHTLSGNAGSSNLSGGKAAAPKKLVSALDHFEAAMDKEAEGNMGDSLKLYRQAYKVTPILSPTFSRMFYHLLIL